MKYTPVRVSTINPKLPLTFDLHLFFKETYLVYKRSGDALEKDKIKKLRKQKVGKFFIDSDDEKKYQAYVDNLLDAVLNDPDMSVEDKTTAVNGAGKSAVEEMRKDPTSKEALKATQKAGNSISTLVQNDPNALKEMYKVESEDDPILQSAVASSALCVRMGQLKGFEPKVLDDLSTACLLRDIGIVRMDQKYHNLFTVPLADYSAIELKIYKTHPELGKNMLEERGDVPPEVIDLVYSHEAKLQGNGFPKEIDKLNPVQAVISLCSAYDRKVSCEGMSPKDAIQDLSVGELGNYDLEDIKFLKKMLKSDGLID